MSRPRGGQQNQGMSKWPPCGHGLAVVGDEGPEQRKTGPGGLIGSGTGGRTSVMVAGAGYDASGERADHCLKELAFNAMKRT
ncbi:hypothetical protein MTO96_037140 [Rhipicephalus appendiculatus]